MQVATGQSKSNYRVRLPGLSFKRTLFFADSPSGRMVCSVMKLVLSVAPALLAGSHAPSPTLQRFPADQSAPP
jgi:hypothetical protein